MYSQGQRPGSVDRGEDATGGAIECDACSLRGCALTQSREPSCVTRHGTGFDSFCSATVYASDRCFASVNSLHDRIEKACRVCPRSPVAAPRIAVRANARSLPACSLGILSPAASRSYCEVLDC